MNLDLTRIIKDAGATKLVQPEAPEISRTESSNDEIRLPQLDPLKFMFAGRAIFTLESLKTGQRFTYRISQPREPQPGMFFVGLLTGPENTTDYTYVGMIRNGEFNLTHRSLVSADAPSVKAFKWFFSRIMEGQSTEGVRFLHAGRCARCGRVLTVPESILTGFGPECAGRML